MCFRRYPRRLHRCWCRDTCGCSLSAMGLRPQPLVANGHVPCTPFSCRGDVAGRLASLAVASTRWLLSVGLPCVRTLPFLQACGGTCSVSVMALANRVYRASSVAALLTAAHPGSDTSMMTMDLGLRPRPSPPSSSPRSESCRNPIPSLLLTNAGRVPCEQSIGICRTSA